MQNLQRSFGQPSEVVILVSRKGERYIIATKVWFNWQGTDGRWMEGEGITRDISGDGLFVLTDTLLKVGTPIVVMVEMPALKMFPKPITFRGSGKIVRIGPEVGGLCGFAAAVTFDDKVRR
jgi:Tfp pilus assembly protein PilZ